MSNYDYRDKHKHETLGALYAPRVNQNKDGNRERAIRGKSGELKAALPNFKR